VSCQSRVSRDFEKRPAAGDESTPLSYSISLLRFDRRKAKVNFHAQVTDKDILTILPKKNVLSIAANESSKLRSFIWLP